MPSNCSKSGNVLGGISIALEKVHFEQKNMWNNIMKTSIVEETEYR